MVDIIGTVETDLKTKIESLMGSISPLITAQQGDPDFLNIVCNALSGILVQLETSMLANSGTGEVGSIIMRIAQFAINNTWNSVQKSMGVTPETPAEIAANTAANAAPVVETAPATPVATS
jgi:hypothetical protein